MEALRDLFCACADLRHELRSADALGYRIYQSLNNTEVQRFTRHFGALLTLEQVTVDYQIAVENLAWQHVSACGARRCWTGSPPMHPACRRRTWSSWLPSRG
ncbi:hypothetical protein GCM10009863_59900 [Streptomyces axinellae]|uniref:Uncharacterized protein n=1 Tax=Streptomyces axinellae TaxID=552788 RepID=A0ABP6D4G1_9ACTN